MSCESRIIGIMKSCGVDTVLTVPCDRVKSLIDEIPKHFKHIPLTREEEGVGICAGLSMAGKKPLMLIQNSGIGNMVNALCSLTKVYQLPLPMLISWRGVYNENIVAQVPMGRYLPAVFDALEIKYETVCGCADVPIVEKVIADSYEHGQPYAALLSPKIWECVPSDVKNPTRQEIKKQSLKIKSSSVKSTGRQSATKPSLTRYELIKKIAPALEGKVIVSNIGITSKELYSVLDQPSNFYMLGSFGLASSIGLGLALGTKNEVIVLDGDGSVLTNPGTLCTIAQEKPKNLTIVAIDNGVHGATGNQPTATSKFIDLENIARSMGIGKTAKVSDGKAVSEQLQGKNPGPSFIHAVVKPGNEKLSDISLSPLEIKRRVMCFLESH